MLQLKLFRTLPEVAESASWHRMRLYKTLIMVFCSHIFMIKMMREKKKMNVAASLPSGFALSLKSFPGFALVF